jgi:hypothetical protein
LAGVAFGQAFPGGITLGLQLTNPPFEHDDVTDGHEGDALLRQLDHAADPAQLVR